MASLFSGLWGGPALKYTLADEPYRQAWGCWTHYPATSKEDGSPASVFKLTASDPNDLKLVAARNGVKRLKLLRHPNVLSFKDSLETQEKGGTTIYIVTEPVKPLLMVMSELELTGLHKDEYLATGILHMTNAVSFINNDCKMIHGHLCMSAVVVTETLDWRLHGFDLLSEAACQGDFALKHASWMVGQQYQPAEVAKMAWGEVAAGPVWAVDSWGLGCMMQEVFSGQPLRAVEQLRQTDCIPPALLEDYQKLLSSTPSRRLNPAQVAESKFLNNKLVKVVGFMENIAVKDSAEKDAFFKRLPSLLPAIPGPVAVRKLLPLLANALEFGGAPASAVGSLLQIGKPLEPEDFVRRVVPCLAKLFASTDRNLRRNLLESVDLWGPHLTQPVVEDQIFPSLQTGFSDDNAYIRELTLKATLALAPRMKQGTLTGTVLRHLNKLQMDPEPSIRANTTVLLGNIADLLGDTYCKKVLLNAFGRALKDPFPPARVAALRALVATIKHYSPEEAAGRGMPAVAPLCVDGIGEVRAAALACIEAFTKLLRTHDGKLTEAAAAAAAGSGAAPQPGASLGNSAAGMLGWAMTSLVGAGNNTGGAAGAAGSNHGGAPAHAAAAPGGYGGGGAPAAAAAARGGFGSSSTPPAAAPAAAADAWDNDDEEFEDLEEKAARSRLGGMSLGATRAGAGASSSGRPAAAAPPVRTTGGHLLPPNQRGARVSGGSGGRLSGGGSGGGAPAAPASSAVSNGWDADGDADGGWEEMGSPTTTSPRPTATPTSAARPRPAAARGVGGGATVGSSGSSGGGGVTARPKGAMKLGASKLGAQKISFDDF